MLQILIKPTDSYLINISIENSLKRNSLKNLKTLSKQIVLPLKIYSLLHLNPLKTKPSATVPLPTLISIIYQKSIKT